MHEFRAYLLMKMLSVAEGCGSFIGLFSGTRIVQTNMLNDNGQCIQDST